MGDPFEAYLMIGNGFDLELRLPTSYKAFLHFLQLVDQKLGGCDGEDIQIDDQIREMLDKDPPTDYWKPVIKTFWYKHFLGCELRDNWIDFESEISRIIQIIEYNMDHLSHRPMMMDDVVLCYNDDIGESFGELISPFEYKFGENDVNGRRIVEYDISFCTLRDMLKKDLDTFISGFEKYLYEYVEKITLPASSCIPNLIRQFSTAKDRYVISFNYTTTIEKVLHMGSTNAKTCYIHGRITDGTKKNQMVLGMDEYLPEEKVRDHVGFASFRKYNQRIIKATDSSYVDWPFNVSRLQGQTRVLYVFGHSLGITDGDIIERFEKAPNMRTVIYYHDEDHLDLAVTNLTAIIGKDEMIKRTGGAKHTLEFRNQEELANGCL